MPGIGQISLLVDSPLRTVMLAFRGMEPAIRKQITAQTKRVAGPVWKQVTAEHSSSLLQTKVLANTARVSVSGLNMRLLSGGGGVLASGTKTATLVNATAFGMGAGKLVWTKSKKGKEYQMRMAGRFNLPRRGGYVVYPAARDVIPRMASLIVQTTVRTMHETVEKVTG